MKVNFKFYLRTLLAAAAVMFMAPGCDDDGPENNGPAPAPGTETPSYTFSVNVSSVLDSRVSVLVTPSELGATFYCGVVTKELFDVFANDAAFLANDVENLQIEAQEREMSYQAYLESVVSVSSTSETVTVPVSGLSKQTEYYAYCYGITLDGVVTSPLAKVAFTSGSPAPVDLVLSSEAQDITTDAVKIAVSALRADGDENAQNGYICEVQLKQTVDDFFADDAALVSALEAMYDKADPSEGMQGKVLHGSQDVAVSGLLSGAEYYMILFGYDSTGVTTEVVKSTFTTKEKSGGNQGGGDEERKGYAAWVGDWTITSTSSEVNGKPVTFNVTIAEDVYNKSFTITGWGISVLRDEPSITIAANYSNGMLTIPNDQLVAQIEDGDVYWKGRFPYNGNYSLISGSFDALEATLGSNNRSATMVGGKFSLQGGGDYTVSSVDIFLKYADGSGFSGYKVADGYTQNDYPIGPYKMTKTADGPVSGGGDDPNPPSGGDVTKKDANFTLSVTNITATSATVSVVPASNTMTYFFDCQNSSLFAGKSDAEIVALFQNGYGDNFVKLMSTGADYYDYTKLTAGTEYTAVVFGYDVNTGKATTSVLSASFTPANNGGGSNPSGNLTFNISVNATATTADIAVTPSNNTDTYYWDMLPKETYDLFSSEAELVSAYNTLFQQNYDATLLDAVEAGPSSFTYDELDPGTEYVAFAFGYDATGQTTAFTTKLFTTEAAGEASEAYNAWIGTWSVKSASSFTSGTSYTFDISVAANVANASYKVTGFGISTVSKSTPVTASFDAATGALVLNCYKTTYTGNTDEGTCPVYYCGICPYNGSYTFVSGSYPALTATGNGSSATMTGNNVSVGGGLTLTVATIDYCIVGQEYVYTYTAADGFTKGDYPIAPFTLTKTAATPAPAYAKAATMSSMLTSAYLGGTVKKAVAREAEITLCKGISAKAAQKAMRRDLMSFVTPAKAQYNPLMQLGSQERFLDREAVASSTSASLKIYKTVSDIRVRTPRTK